MESDGLHYVKYLAFAFKKAELHLWCWMARFSGRAKTTSREAKTVAHSAPKCCGAAGNSLCGETVNLRVCAAQCVPSPLDGQLWRPRGCWRLSAKHVPMEAYRFTDLL